MGSSKSLWSNESGVEKSCKIYNEMNHTFCCFSLSIAELSHDYYMKVVPTVYEDLWGEQKISYQYTYAYKVGLPWYRKVYVVE